MKPSSILVYLFLACALATSACSSGFEDGQALGSVSKKKLKEISGMAASGLANGIFWVHNDGKAKQVFTVNSRGTVLGDLSIKSLEITDLEDIAIGPGPKAGAPYVYLGDIGDNDKIRETIRVTRFIEPNPIASLKNERPQFEKFQLRYPDGKFDSEALLVDSMTGDLIVSTKGKRTRIYMVKQDQLVANGTATLTFVSTISAAKVSAGDVSAHGNRIIMRNETHAWIWNRKPTESVAVALSRNPEAAPVIGPPTEPNGEAITFERAGKGYFTLSEGVEATIFYFANRRS